jgi:hypothetical protein
MEGYIGVPSGRVFGCPDPTAATTRGEASLRHAGSLLLVVRGDSPARSRRERFAFVVQRELWVCR